MTFTSDEGEVWVASFRAGGIVPGRKLATPDGCHFFVLAGGICCCVDAAAKALTGVLPGPQYQDLVPIPGTDLIAIANWTEVDIASEGGRIVWSTPRLAWDGIRLTHATETHVMGVADNGYGPSGERDFTIDLVSRTVTGGYVADFRQ